MFLGPIAHNIFFSIQATPGHYAIGLKILSQLISEMNQVRAWNSRIKFMLLELFRCWCVGGLYNILLGYLSDWVGLCLFMVELVELKKGCGFVGSVPWGGGGLNDSRRFTIVHKKLIKDSFTYHIEIWSYVVNRSKLAVNSSFHLAWNDFLVRHGFAIAVVEATFCGEITMGACGIRSDYSIS